MSSQIRSPLFYAWLAIVLVLGLVFSFTSNNESLIPGEALLEVGFLIMVFAGLLGCIRTGKWSTWDGRMDTSEFEWSVALTGVAVLAAPILHLIFVVLYQLVSGKAL